MLNEKVRRKAAEKHASYLEKEKKWFKPSIGKSEAFLRRKPVSNDAPAPAPVSTSGMANKGMSYSSFQDYAKENIEQRVERLSIQEHERIRRDRERCTEEYYSRYTYEPEINKVSQFLARPSTTQDLVSKSAMFCYF